MSESAYFFTNLLSAASFLETCTAQQLSMDGEEGEREFERRLQEGLEATQGGEEEEVGGAVTAETGVSEGGARTAREGGAGPSSGSAPPVSSSGGGPERQAARQPAARVRESVVRVDQMLASEGVVSELVRADASGELGRTFKYLYATAGDLRVGDVEQLLAEYKDVVIR